MTLRTLLEIKVRRERSIRSAITVLTDRADILSEQKNKLLEERHIIWDEWRNCGANEQVLDHVALQDMKIELAKYCQRDASIVEHMNGIQSTGMQLQLENTEQQSLLKKVLVEQEKLTFLLE